VLDGVNLMPYLTGAKKGAPHEVLFWRWLGQSAIRKGAWKYLRSDNRAYLFNMENDAEETKNLLAAHPEIAKDLHAELERWAGTLSPPGVWALKSEGMSRAAAAYYHWYLDGKRDPVDPEAPTQDRKGKKKAPARPAPSDKQLFEQRDADKDGVVTWEEFLAGRTGDKVPALEKNFKRRDTNGNGIWEQSEL